MWVLERKGDSKAFISTFMIVKKIIGYWEREKEDCWGSGSTVYQPGGREGRVKGLGAGW